MHISITRTGQVRNCGGTLIQGLCKVGTEPPAGWIDTGHDAATPVDSPARGAIRGSLREVGQARARDFRRLCARKLPPTLIVIEGTAEEVCPWLGETARGRWGCVVVFCPTTGQTRVGDRPTRAGNQLMIPAQECRDVGIFSFHILLRLRERKGTSRSRGRSCSRHHRPALGLTFESSGNESDAHRVAQ